METELRGWKTNLESRVVQRTEELTAAHKQLEVTEYRRTPTACKLRSLDAVEAEQLRLGQELHDGLAQELVGVRDRCWKCCHRNLMKPSPGDAAGKRERLGYQQKVEGALTEKTRHLATGFYPVDVERKGLLIALQELAKSTTKSFGVSCTARGDKGAPQD